jgi:hypothetical protein
MGCVRGLRLFSAGIRAEPAWSRAVGKGVILHLPTFALALATTAFAASAARPQFLEQAVDNWLGERDHWAFTQRAVEYDGGKPLERLERYDPSRPGNQRWMLLAINGRTPTPEEREAWARKKFRKKPRRFDTPIGDFFAFKDASVIRETPRTVSFRVPLRNDKSWLFQADKLRMIVTVNKETRALEHLSADISEPVKVLLGLARILDGQLDLSFLNFDVDAEPGPENSQPKGSATVTVSKFGERVEFTWSEFTRVTPHADRVARDG